jgi:hypothetical protein
MAFKTFNNSRSHKYNGYREADCLRKCFSKFQSLSTLEINIS